MRWLISLSAVAALFCGVSDNVALAQHRHHSHGHSYWGSGHHYSPAHIDVHRGHLDLHSGHHSTPIIPFGGHNHHHHYSSGYGYGATWFTPVVTQPVYSQPSTVIVNAAPAQPQQLPAPKFGAYAQVPRVASDLADFANSMCLTMHRRFQNRPGFNGTYRVAYGVLQQAQAIRAMSNNPGTREEVTKRLTQIDDDMHRVFADVGEWVNDPNGATADDINTLKQDAGQVGGALHYLMVDVGIAHKDQDPAVAARQSQPLPPPPPTDGRTVLKPGSPSDDPAAPKASTQPTEPKFGAYANVPKVASDVAALANRLCLTMHRGFRDREDFDDAYAAAYSVLQQSQKIRDLARDPDSRQELAKRLEKLDEGMHSVFAEVGEWTNDPKLAGNREIDNLKREFGTLGSAVHFLMTDVGVQHHDDEPGEGDPPAPLPKPKTTLPKPPATDE
ncbi:MAG: hypothetical protein ACKV2Q_15340 [Planctomycetaceae bacterium]